jgi:hypothetical protein
VRLPADWDRVVGKYRGYVPQHVRY